MNLEHIVLVEDTFGHVLKTDTVQSGGAYTVLRIKSILNKKYPLIPLTLDEVKQGLVRAGFRIEVRENRDCVNISKRDMRYFDLI